MKKRLRLLLGAAVVAVFPTTPLLAGTMTYTDRSTFNTEVISLFATGFSANASGTTLTPNQQVGYNTSNGYLTNDIQVVGMIGSGYTLTQAYGNATYLTYYNWGSGPILRSADATASNSATVRITFRNGGAPIQVSAFGMDLGVSGGAGVLTIAPEGLPSYTINTLAQPTLQFAGLASDSRTFGYVDITLTAADRYIVVDNAIFGTFQTSGGPVEPPQTSETPDGATLLYVATGLGLVLLGCSRRTLQNA